MGIDANVGKTQQHALKKLALRAEPYADAERTAASASSLRTADRLGISRLDRSAVRAIASFNSNILAKNPDLLKMKYQAMAESPFSFLRGSDHLMYQDLQQVEGKALDAGPKTLLQGDMHLANFGSMARPDGGLFLALNDFDEAYIGPAKLDLKRLATSVVLAGKQAGLSPSQTRKAVADLAQTYYDTMQAQGSKPTPIHAVPQPEVVQKTLEAAQKVKPEQWLAQKTETHAGKLMLKRSATMTSVSDKVAKDVKSAFEEYRSALPKGAAKDLAHYQVSDIASAVEGTGSIGRARYHLLLTAGGKHPPLILEMKEEVPAAMAPYVKTPNVFGAQANRDLLTSYAMDGRLDPYFGKVKLPKRDALQSSSFLVRQVEPSKAAIDPTTVHSAGEFSDLVKYYAREVAISHSAGEKAGLAGSQEILASLGPKPAFTSELVDFGHQYAQQVERDFKDFKAALASDALLEHAIHP